MVKVFGHLIKDVVEPGYCIGCASCIATCPVQCLQRQNEVPVLAGVCINCGICYGMCPEIMDSKSLQEMVFGARATDEFLGVYLQTLSVESRDEKVRSRVQDGGAVTALLGALLEDGYIDAAVVTGIGGEPWKPVARVATNIDELIACAGTKYSRAPTALGLRDAVRLYYRQNLAIVGTPCQIRATRRMRLSTPTNAHLADAIKLRVGLFCGGVFKYDQFFKGIIEGELRIPLADVVKFDVRGDKFEIYLKQGEKRELDLKAVKRYMDLPCKVCCDFSAELADISAGAVGSPLGRSTVLIRTQTGVEALNIALRSGKIDAVDLKEVSPGIGSVRQDAKLKKESAQLAVDELKKEGKVLPVWLMEQAPEYKEPIEPIREICPV